MALSDAELLAIKDQRATTVGPYAKTNGTQRTFALQPNTPTRIAANTGSRDAVLFLNVSVAMLSGAFAATQQLLYFSKDSSAGATGHILGFGTQNSYARDGFVLYPGDELYVFCETGNGPFRVSTNETKY